MLQNVSLTVSNNQTNVSFEQEKENEFSTEKGPFTICYLVMTLIGLLGNSLVITAVRRNRNMRSTTNILLAFVAVADFISLVCFIPFALLLSFRLPRGIFGAVLCWIFASGNVANVTIVVSITTLTLLAIERYHALLKPMKNRLRLSSNNVYYWICGISLYAIALIAPFFVFTKYDKSRRTCLYDFGQNGRRIYFSFFGFGVALASFIICFCYSRIIKGFYFGNNKVCINEELQHKRKVVKMLLLVTLAFIVCFTPRAVYFLFYTHDRGLFHQISFFLLHCNSAVNPIILGFQSKNYRREFKTTIGEVVSKMKRVRSLCKVG